MKVETIILNNALSPHFISRNEFDDESLIKGAMSRYELAHNKGEAWIKDGISLFGLDVVKAVNTGEHSDFNLAIWQLVIFQMVHETVFLNVDFKTYKNSVMKFTITQTGIVLKEGFPDSA